MKKIVPILALAVLAAACGSQEVKKDVPVSDRTSSTTQPGKSGSASTTTPSQQSAIAANPLKDPKNILSQRSVYFEFDSNAVKDEYRGLVQAHSKYMVDKRDTKIRIEGNCDERGSREYNLALGQKRAEAVKQALLLLGASESQIESVSLGEEKPRCEEATETCFAENRRADMLYSGEF